MSEAETTTPAVDAPVAWPALTVTDGQDLARRLNDLRWMLQRTKIEQAKAYIGLSQAELSRSNAQHRLSQRIGNLETKLDQILARLPE